MSKFDFKVLSTSKEGKRCQIRPSDRNDETEEKIFFLPIDWEGIVERNEDDSGELTIAWIENTITIQFDDDEHLTKIIEHLT